ncbi:3'-5' exoribonuclease [Nocardia sp. CC227C]|uniref:3'-5' exoribonuclease n=1 Tax=Nocardia sp. CC227C TaxID=3044562 RepID=UPI00278C4763|nr:3'-5' exoribonuclease [Nocardia sp. CC227C]
MSDRTIYAYDTEFLEDGRTIELISIGIVSDTGREYYAVNSDMPVDRIKADPWLLQNVWSQLPLRGHKSRLQYTGQGDSKHGVRLTAPGVLDTSSVLVKPKWVIANEVREFLLAEGTPSLWADYGAYDHVVLAQLWGRMIRLPKGLPMFTNELQQALEKAPEEFTPPEQTEGIHNALEDARHTMRVLKALLKATSHG